MKLPEGLDLISAINAAWNWPAAMDHLAKNVTEEDLAAAVQAWQKEHPDRNVWNGPLRDFPQAIKDGKYPYPEPELKGNPKIREGLIMGIEEKLPLSFEFSEADSFGGYLILSRDQIIATGDYQDPVKNLNEMSLKDLALAFEEGRMVADPLEDCSCDEWIVPYLQFFAKELGVEPLLKAKASPAPTQKKQTPEPEMGL
jgi:hypothetical protein